MTKLCAHCGETKPTSEFYKGKVSKMRVCKACHLIRCNKARSSKPREHRSALNRRQRVNNLENRKAAEKKWNQKRRAAGWFYTPEKRAYHKTFRVRLKTTVFQAYGGRCECCGETEIACLTIDHVNNDGGRDRKAWGRGASQRIYARLRREGYPPNYRVLCFSCNTGRHIAGGTECPHQLEVAKLWQGLIEYAAKQQVAA